ncbi:MAG: hypothetical protein QHH14_13850 [Clostridiales bacterium]|nr:hypothetical protein [Clostridiales bacterium]
MEAVLWVYIRVAFSGLVYFIINALKFQTKKKLAGTTYFKWSSKFNLGIPANRINWMIVSVYLAATIYFVVTEPKMVSDYLLIVIFILFFSHYPKWNRLVGSKGSSWD